MAKTPLVEVTPEDLKGWLEAKESTAIVHGDRCGCTFDNFFKEKYGCRVRTGYRVVNIFGGKKSGTVIYRLDALADHHGHKLQARQALRVLKRVAA